MERFIHKNIVAELERLGYDRNIALSAADVGIQHYKTATCSRKGKIFDECLFVAKRWAAHLK